MMHWWRARQGAADCGAGVACGPAYHGSWSGHAVRWHAASPDAGEIGAAFGVRRPLRFLAWKLALRDDQVAKLARILNELKTERAQAEVDGRRTTAAFADAVAGAAFDERRAREGAALRVQSAERLRDRVLEALADIHAILEPEQRERLAYLIRTGTLTI
jgi:Spy/CpxP family protein refolding chaperone